jgi:hypothetical protein
VRARQGFADPGELSVQTGFQVPAGSVVRHG